MRSRTLYLASLLTAVFLVLLVAGALATREARASPGTLYVSADGLCGGNLPCYTNVQNALNVADPFDEILVATGTYTDPAGTVAEIAESITLQGGWNTGFTSQDPNTYPTTLDAQRNGRVIEITGNISPTIDGFIITGGDATGESSYAGQGGGIYSTGADPIIVNNVITDNIAHMGTTGQGFGGGIYLRNASAPSIISGNTIISNTASTGSFGVGGGLHLWNSAVTISGNTISDNTAPSYGGGLTLDDTDNSTLNSNRVISNTASVGGGLHIQFTSPFTLANSIIAQNFANTEGGGLYVMGTNSYTSSGELVNNTFAQNNLGSGGEAIYSQNPFPITLTNNIIVTHTYGIYAYYDSAVTADYTLFYGNTNDTAGGGSINSTHEVSGDPVFVDPAARDYHIRIPSAAIDAGTATPWLTTDIDDDPRPLGTAYDIGADESPCWHLYLPFTLKNY